MHTITVTVKGQEPMVVAVGTRISELLPSVDRDGFPVLGAVVNNMVQPLFMSFITDAKVEPLTIRDPRGWAIYRASLCFLLAKTVHELFPDVGCRVRNSIGTGLYCTVEWEECSEDALRDQVARLKQAMLETVRQDLTISTETVSYETAVKRFRETGQTDKLNLLAHRNPPVICLTRCGTFFELSQEPLVSRTGVLNLFDLTPLSCGFVLTVPTPDSPSALPPLPPFEHLFRVYREHIEWGRIVGITTVGELNQAVIEKRVDDFIQTVEALHDKKLGRIADEITQREPSVRLVLVAGPSSAGKTTFSKRLITHLRVNGYRPLLISTDNYFVGDARNPRDAEGRLDYEHIEAMDLQRLNRDLLRLLAREEVHLRGFDFKTKEGYDRPETTRLPDNGIIVMEGIHSLNPQLIADVPRDRTFRIYINALTQLGVDSSNRISTTDTRIIRRMVRDHRFRNRPAIETLRMWPSIVRGEQRWIYPFEHLADAVFNSALDYELAVLKPLIAPLLNQIKPWDEVYIEARRLSGFLHNFTPLSPDVVPGDSILREYIGGSQLTY
ncbi:MAG TPA: nucleoside kinase [Kiritimatiellia bacterium]|jgi:uridine kinase|nr:nucleoside kinase [Kiritimatiellia bacterium]HOM59105.1 nucleoside kinase [Kiritimatiellia bacterium]HOR98543.1 nucleoside kinase [Kiritimatiellia bacterium]HPW74854.1 nucleoside kinase [Kiritimatiellia bacterium]HRU19584.1 nucleoside kinase [Kiritimatiellia bacterium]